MLATAGAGVIAVLAIPQLRRGTNGLAPPVNDPTAGLDAETAYQRALELTVRQEWNASLPFFRRAIAARPEYWQLHCDYASALMNTAGESRVHRGLPVPRMRSTRERVERMIEAHAEIARGESLATTAEERAYALGLRAQVYANWGMPWDAVDDYTRSLALDPSSEKIRRDAVFYVAAMRRASGETP